MYHPDNLRNRFDGGLDTMSGPQIVTMCFERLRRDLDTADAAIAASEHYDANVALGHAQDLIGEMATMLDVDAWEHAPSLLAVYDYLLRVLALANMRKDPALVREARAIIIELGEAFAAAAASQQAATAPPREQPTAGAAGSNWSVRA